MPYQQPLTTPILHCADPIDLHVRSLDECGGRGEGVLSAVVRAEVVGAGDAELTLKTVNSNGESLLVQLIAAEEGVIRVRLAPDADSTSRSAAALPLVSSAGCPGATVSVDSDRVRVSAVSLVVEARLDDWHLRFMDPAGTTLVAEDADATDISGRLRVLPLGRSLVGPAVAAYHETFEAPADEHYFGFGEKFTTFDKRGQRIVCWNYDAFGAESERSYKNIPFYLSSRGYGVLVDSGLATEFDMCHSTHSCVQITVPDDQLDYYVIAGPTPADVIERLHRLTGRPVPPPAWALGTWISAGFEPDTQQGVLDRARTIRARGIPCDVLHIDAHWMPHGRWSDMRWDDERFPDPAGMFAHLRRLGFRTCLWICPYLSVESPLYEGAAASGHLLRRTDGSAYASDVWHGYHPPCGIVDFTKPEATRWFQALLRPLLEQGADVFKTDFGEGVPVDAVASNGMLGVELHNVYPLLFNDAVAAVTEEVNGHRVVWARSSFTGGQRHCAQWAGDTNATYRSMASTLRGGLSYALSGVPFWSHDVGGFTGEPPPDLFVRSAQFGALSPLIRFHGNTARLPWQFGEAVERAVVDVLRLRYRLMPYIYTASVRAAESGVGVLRPLVLAAPHEPPTWAADLEYLFGPDLLVAPVTDPTGTRHVYLPSGSWVDYWSGEVFAGGRHISVTAPLDRIPLFVRHHALIPMTEDREIVGDTPFRSLIVACWGRAGGTVDVLGPDGTTRIAVTCDRSRVEATSAGPGRLRGLAFPPVGGAVVEQVHINGVRAELRPVDGWPTAMVDRDDQR